jgi:hypothetical protein
MPESWKVFSCQTLTGFSTRCRKSGVRQFSAKKLTLLYIKKTIVTIKFLQKRAVDQTKNAKSLPDYSANIF